MLIKEINAVYNSREKFKSHKPSSAGFVCAVRCPHKCVIVIKLRPPAVFWVSFFLFISISLSLFLSCSLSPHSAFIGIVSIVMRLWALCCEGLLLGRRRRFLCSPNHADRLWALPIPLFIVYQKFFIWE